MAPFKSPPDNQIPLLLQTKKDEIDERRKVDHLIEIKETIGQDPSGSQTNKSVNQILDKRFENFDNSSIESTTIFKVTVGLSESNSNAYKQKLISIGPYHKYNLELGSMEKYKLRYLRRFLKRKRGGGRLDVQSCMSEMVKLKDDALKCYDDIGHLDNILVNFLEMLLLDGCFVVEYNREHCGMKLIGENKIIKRSCTTNQVWRDLLLVKNQLPFFVLTKFHDMTKEVEISITKLVMLYLVRKLNMTHASFLETEGNEKNIKHLLRGVHVMSVIIQLSWIILSTQTKM
ncbi:putative UPF0481 protein At3g02645 [Lycium ferocissimum]|uniref:putative UPF0481 protein At3g02645 n=1 Tax=Lycium ferocissimum TaxID=112874 RepID=UPI002814AE67|nr:putative UPF0481 protein At3g02645 [Lycium ferocissimum]